MAIPMALDSWEEGQLGAEEAEDHVRQVHEEHGPGGRDDPHPQPLGDLDDPGAVEEQHHEEHADGEAHRLQHDAVPCGVVEP